MNCPWCRKNHRKYPERCMSEARCYCIRLTHSPYCKIAEMRKYAKQFREEVIK